MKNMKIKKIFTFVLLLTLLATVTACMDDAPRDRPTFNNSSVSNTTDGTDTTDTDTFDGSRPDGAVFLQAGFCGCKAGEAITLGNCDNFCASKSSEQNAILYINTIVNNEISLNEDLKDLYGWCNNAIINPDTGESASGNASCVIRAKDSSGVVGELTLNPVKSGDSPTIEVDITNLALDKTYRVSIVEVSSGSSSDMIQVRRFSEPFDEVIKGPLWTEPINQYTCFSRLLEQQDSDLFYVGISRVMFYFNSETRPDPLPAGVADFYCHDYFKYGTTPINDPLLEETPQAFTLWDIWDPRFFDYDSNNILTIHEILQNKVIEQGYNMDTAPEVFFKFTWPTGVDVSQLDTGSGSTSSSTNTEDPDKALGYYMTPWVDQNTFKAYCPKQAHYYSTNQLFVAMREVVGVDTEGLYVAKQAGASTYMLIKESLLKSIWFYIESGQHVEPNNDTVTGKQVQFYWPADPLSPFIKKSHQQVYTIKAASDLNTISSGQAGSNGAPSNYPPHDKRIGCVPAL